MSLRRNDDFDLEKYKVSSSDNSQEVDDFDPEMYKASSIKKIDEKPTPYHLKMVEKFLESSNHPLKEVLKQRFQALGRGFTDVGEGAKQLYLGAKEGMGYAPPGTQDKYTQEREAERNFYNTTPAGKDPYAQLIRGAAASSPELALAPALRGASLLGKMIKGAALGGAAGTAQYVEPNNTRAWNALVGSTVGTALPVALEAPNLIKSLVKGTGKLKNAFKDISPLEKKMAEVNQSHAQAEDEYKKSIGQARAEGVPVNPDVAQNKSMMEQKNLQDTYEKLGEKPPVLPKNIEQSEADLDKANLNHQAAIQFEDEAKNQIANHLNKGAAHDVRAARMIKEKERTNRKQISSGYDELENEFSQKQIKVDNAPIIQSKNEELKSIIRSGDLRGKDATNLLNELDRLKKEKSVNAQDYLRAYRSASQYAREARSKAYTPGMNAEEREEWKRKYNELDDKVHDMGKTLEESVGDQDFGKLKELNSRWRNEVVPLYKNRTFQNIRNNGQMPSNIMNTLRGDNEGNLIIKGIIKQDPEILKNVVGQRYAAKPEGLHDIGEVEQEYVNEMPELKDLINQHKEARDLIPEAKKNLEESSKFHQENIKNASEYQKNRSKVDEIQDRISKLDKNIQDLRQNSAKKNISLQEKVKIEKELDRAKSDKENAMKKLLIIGGIGSASVGVPAIGYKIAKLFSSNGQGE